MDAVSKYKPKKDNENKLKCYLNINTSGNKEKKINNGKFNRQ
jgi:hypothetical protein